MQLQLRQEVSQAGGHLQDAALMATAVSCPYSSSRAGAPALLLVALLLAAASWTTTAAAKNDTQRFRPGDELRRYRRVQALLKRLNKPALRSIQAQPRRRPHRLRAGAPAAGLRPPEAARPEATGGGPAAGEAQGESPPRPDKE